MAKENPKGISVLSVLKLHQDERIVIVFSHRKSPLKRIRGCLLESLSQTIKPLERLIMVSLCYLRRNLRWRRIYLKRKKVRLPKGWVIEDVQSH